METLKYIFIFTFILVLTGCGDSDNSNNAVKHGGTDRLQRGGIRGADPVQRGSFDADVSRDAYGNIYAYTQPGDSYQQNLFQSAAKDFLYPIIDSKDLGEISGNLYSNTTGINFYGKGIKLNPGKERALDQLSAYGVTQVNISGDTNIFDTRTSELRIEVHDSFVDSDVITIIPIHFNDNTTNKETGGLVYSSIENNGKIRLLFEDDLGAVMFEGSIYGESFEGDFYFRNYFKVRVDSNGNTTRPERINGEALKLGNFIVPACDFFDVRRIGDLNCR